MKTFFLRGDLILFNTKWCHARGEYLASLECKSLKTKNSGSQEDIEYLGIVVDIPSLKACDDADGSNVIHRRIDQNKIMVQVRVIAPVHFWDYTVLVKDSLENFLLDHEIEINDEACCVSRREGFERASIRQQGICQGGRENAIFALKTLRGKEESDIESGFAVSFPTLTRDQIESGILRVEQAIGRSAIGSKEKHKCTKIQPEITLTEVYLRRPSKAYKQLQMARQHRIGNMFVSCENFIRRLNFQRYCVIILRLKHDDLRAVTVIQTYARCYLQRSTIQQMKHDTKSRALRDKWWQTHEHFPYQRDPIQQRSCYNVKGTAVFLPTLSLASKWSARMETAIQTITNCQRNIVRNEVINTLAVWRKVVLDLRLVAQGVSYPNEKSMGCSKQV